MSNQPVKVALYARVSTDDQGQDPEVQLIHLRDYANAQGYTIVEEFVDNGVSGTNPNKPAFNRMMKLIESENKPFEVILVMRMDRVERRGYDDTRAILVKLSENGVKLIPIMEPQLFSMDEDTNELMTFIYTWSAKKEVKLIRARIKEGIVKAKRAGKQIGRKPKYNYVEYLHALEYIKEGKLTPTQIEKITKVSRRQQGRIRDKLKCENVQKDGGENR